MPRRSKKHNSNEQTAKVAKNSSKLQGRKRTRSRGDIATVAERQPEQNVDQRGSKRTRRTVNNTDSASVARRIIFGDDSDNQEVILNVTGKEGHQVQQVQADLDAELMQENENFAQHANVIDNNEHSEIADQMVQQHVEHNLNDGVQISVNSDEENDFEDGVDSEQSCDEDDGPNVEVVQRSEAEMHSASDDDDDDEALMKNPKLMRMMNKMLDQKLKDMVKDQPCMSKDNHTQGNVNNSRRGKPMLKSPSDTTIYVPALNKYIRAAPVTATFVPRVNNEAVTTNGAQQIVIQDRAQPEMVKQVAKRADEPISNIDIYDKISNFVEAIRIEEDGKRRSSVVQVPGQEEAVEHAERAIVEAEKFKATIDTPPGKEFDNCQDILECREIGTGLTDDDFFHLTSHIEQGLQQKIERGEFVDLDKLLPKDKTYGGTSENRMEWVHKDGCTYLAPVNKESKINGIRKWEQAFRVYATIYCGANPKRAKEVWQYIGVINTAAASYMWDNVANYDITFRHLMQFNPTRNWAVTYNQMWNLSMKDPLPKNYPGRTGGAMRSFGNGSGGNPNFGSSSHRSNSVTSGGGNTKRNKNDYCWSFNRGQICRFGNKCKFIERCSYCDSGAHGVHVCPKLDKKDQVQDPLSISIIQAITGNHQKVTSKGHLALSCYNNKC